MSDLNSLDINLLENASNSLIPNPYQFLNETSEVFPKSSNSYPLSLNSGYEAKSVNQKLAASIPAQSTTTSADLLISNATIPSLGIAGSSISVNYTEFNQGGISASGHYVDFYLSTDNIFSSNDSLLGYNYLNSLAAGSSSPGSKQLSLSSSLTSGTYYLFVKADGINQVAESNESNNLFSQAITINNSSTTPRPDLIISSATIPTTATAGSLLNISYTERNNGTSSAASHSVNFYLSTDSIFSSNDTFLGQNTISSLGANLSSSGSKQLSLSNSLAAGTYYLFIKADGADQIVESNESNNLFSQAISVNTPLPTDLFMKGISSISGAMVGGSIYINYEEMNQGSGAAGTHAVNIYLSADDLLSSNDLLLGSSPVNSLAARVSTGPIAMNLPLSSSLTPGNYYIIFKADGNNNIAETDENNNLMKLLVNISPPLPDLQISNVTLSNYQISNNTLAVSYRETNKGILQAASHKTRFYVSTDSSISSDDILLGDSISPIINVGASYSDFKTFTLDNNLAHGSYYLLVKADGENEVAEINELNNSEYAYFTVVKPDLKIESVTVPSSVIAGTNFTVNYTDRNLGNITASAHAVKFYLSTDNTLSNEDLLLGDSPVNSLASNSTYPDTKTFTLDSSLTAGNYYLLIQTDANEQVTESNENNNIYAQMFTVASPIDLSIKGISTVSGAMIGRNLLINYEEINQGNGVAGTHTVNVYLSTDDLLSSNDFLLGSSWVNSLAAGASTDSIWMNLPLSNSLTPGSYYIIFKADGNNNIAETNENNNLMKQLINISPPLPDLQISSASSNYQVSNNTLAVSYTETNKGILQAASHKTQFYVSTDYILSSDDILLGDSVVPVLDVGASYSDLKTFTLNNNLPHGFYQLLVKADGQNEITEINEGNNFGFSSFTFVQPDLRIEGVTMPNSVQSGATFTVNYTDRNVGTTAASAHTVKFYLSTDNTLSNEDLLLGDSAISSLAFNSTYPDTKTLTLDSSLAVGVYYLLIQTDANEQVIEDDENNNVYAQIFTVTSPIDLSMRWISTDSGAMVGGSLRINYEEINKGSNAAGTHAVNIYLSTDDLLTSNDLLLGSSPVNSLATGASTGSIAMNLPLNSSLTPGSYYIIFKADGNNNITEANENNNLMKQLINISPPLPDLQISKAALSNSQISNNTLAVNYTETNTGILQATSHKTQFYLSTDSSISSDDILLGDSVIPTIDVGASYSDIKTFTLDSNLLPRKYYLIVKTDGLNEVAEINELNNFRSTSFSLLKPDLKIESVTMPSSVLPGATFTVDYNDRNQGNTAASAHAVKFYLSTDSTFSNEDLLLGDTSIGSQPSYSIYTYTKTLTLDSSLTLGDYYLLIQTDANAQVTESNENNNVYAQMFTVTSSIPTPAQPDLKIENVTTYPNNSVKGSLTLSYDIRNQGDGSAASHQVNFYLSTDNILSSEDTFLGSDSLKPIAGNKLVTHFKQIFFQGNPLGNQFIIIKVDGLEEIAESNELNNLYSLPIFFSF